LVVDGVTEAGVAEGPVVEVAKMKTKNGEQLFKTSLNRAPTIILGFPSRSLVVW
jgi:hypothetical protein